MEDGNALFGRRFSGIHVNFFSALEIPFKR
jgi:hypothetical protein